MVQQSDESKIDHDTTYSTLSLARLHTRKLGPQARLGSLWRHIKGLLHPSLRAVATYDRQLQSTHLLGLCTSLFSLCTLFSWEEVGCRRSAGMVAKGGAAATAAAAAAVLLRCGAAPRKIAWGDMRLIGRRL